MSPHVAARNASADSGSRKFTATLADGKGIAVESSTGMRMPDDVAEAARAALGGGEIHHEFAWMSWAGTVWRLDGDSSAIYVRRAVHLAGARRGAGGGRRRRGQRPGPERPAGSAGPRRPPAGRQAAHRLPGRHLEPALQLRAWLRADVPGRLRDAADD